MSGRPKRKRRRPQRLCEQETSLWREEEIAELPPSSDEEDSDTSEDASESASDHEVHSGPEYISYDPGDHEEEEEEEEEDPSRDAALPPRIISKYFRRTALSKGAMKDAREAKSRKELNKGAAKRRRAQLRAARWWWDRLDAHVAFACAAGSIIVLSLILGLLAVQSGAADDAYRLGEGASKGVWGGLCRAMGWSSGGGGGGYGDRGWLSWRGW